MSSLKFQTVSRNSLLTHLDFRTKLVMMVTVTLIAFLWESPLTGGILTLIVGIACLLSGVRLGYLATILKLTLPFYVILLIIMGLFNIEQVKLLTNKEVLTPLISTPETWHFLGGLTISQEGTLYGVNVILKTLTMILVLPLGIFTSDINQIVIGLVRLNIPYKIVFIISSTLSFFPQLFASVQAILEAQKLRGLDLERLNLFSRLRVYATVAVPLILNAMNQSQMLEVVLQSKAFSGSSKRTYLQETQLTSLDLILMSLFIALFILVIILYFGWGVGKFAWLLWQ
ncbi:MAG: energy-coupling factor transporter transmembrane protein EcfT [Microcystaceae cyanobacterium]